MITGIIPEWQEADNKEKKGTIAGEKCKRQGAEKMGQQGGNVHSLPEMEKNHHKRRSWTRGEERNGGKGRRQREDIRNATLGQGQVDIKKTRAGEAKLNPRDGCLKTPE
eukprot:6176359-Pleurochrysis_carterae.AAC.1